MIKTSQFKWIVMAICFWLGAIPSFAGWNPIMDSAPVKAARDNCDKYSQLIKYSNDQVNQLCDQMDKNRDGSAVGNPGDLTKQDAVTLHQQSLAAFWKTQANIQTLLPIVQRCRDAAYQYAASNPSDKQGVSKADQLQKVYNAYVNWANKNSDRIDRATTNLRLNDDSGTKYPDAPVRITAVPPSLTPDPDAPFQPPLKTVDLNKVAQEADSERRQQELDDSRKTVQNVDKLIDNFEAWKNYTKAKSDQNPDDLNALNDAINAQDDYDKLKKMRDNANNRITDLGGSPDGAKSAGDGQNPPKPDDKKSADDGHNQANPDDQKVEGNGLGPLNILDLKNALGGVVMAPDQGDEATQKFVAGVTVGDNGTGDQASNNSKNNGGANLADVARDANRDAIDAARDAGRNAGREAGHDAARGAVDNCPHGGCH